MKYLIAASEALFQTASVFVSIVVIVWCVELLITASTEPLKRIKAFADQKFNNTQAA